MATIRWLCPKPVTPSGGVDVIHRNAYLLDKNGVRSRVHQVEPFDCWWNANPVPENIYKHEEQIDSGDTVVIPEVMWKNESPKYANSILFLQNYIWLDRSSPLEGVRVLAASRHMANWARREIKANVIGISRPYLDDGVWLGHPKVANRVLVVNRRGQEYAGKLRDQIIGAGFDVDFCDKPMTQREMAQHFKDAEFYAHAVTPEGFPAICVEAMRSGTLVVGTPGGGGVEFMFNKETAWVCQDPVYAGISVDQMIGQIVDGLVALRADAKMRSEMWQKAHNWSLRYNEGSATGELLKVFKNG